MSDIEKTLKERGDRYGSFIDHAKIAQALQDTMRGSEGWGALAADQKQALTVIADKIARMLNGQPNYRDNWHDIVGYAKLVDDRLALSEVENSEGKSWIRHDGYKCPVSEGDIIDVLCRDRSVMTRVPCESGGSFWRWSEGSSKYSDIIGYFRHG